MSTKIRQAEEKDISRILEIINYEILNSTVVYHYKERTLKQQIDWFKEKNKNKFPVFVAEKNNEILGFGTYGIFRPWEAYKFSVEHSIYVDKDSRGLGIGKILMTELINLATNEGYHTIIAGIDVSNKKSIEFHENFGFKEIGTFKEIGFKFNRWLDLVFMQLFLDK